MPFFVLQPDENEEQGRKRFQSYRDAVTENVSHISLTLLITRSLYSKSIVSDSPDLAKYILRGKRNLQPEEAFGSRPHCSQLENAVLAHLHLQESASNG